MLIGCLGIVRVRQGSQRVSQVEEGIRVVGIEFGGAADRFDGLLATAKFSSHEPHAVVIAGRRWISANRPAEEFQTFCSLALLV